MIRKLAASLGVLGTIALVACSSAREDTGSNAAAIDYICSETAAATLDGIPAYAYCGNTNVFSNNGVDTKSTSGGAGWVQTEGGYGYQCVEYAIRYLHFKFGVGTGWGISYAKEMCVTHPSGVTVTNTPVHGDLIIFAASSCGADATAGHVAVVDTVGTSTVAAVQENVAGKYTYNKSCASCFLHATANNGSTDPCVTAPSNGFYCGQSTQWGGGTKDVLYDCENGATKSSTPCAGGCIIEPLGTNDQCAPAPVDAGSDATTDASTNDAAPPSDAAPKNDASPGSDAGNGPPSTGGCATAPSSSDAWLFAVGIIALTARSRKRRSEETSVR